MNYRIVTDTNVIISAILNPSGRPAAIIDAVLDDRLFLILSHVLLNEARRVLSYEKIVKELNKAGSGLKEAENALDKLSGAAYMVPGKLTIDTIKDDPDDNMVLVCAVEGQADYIISGDRHLTALDVYQGIEIKSPAEFWSIFQSMPSV